MSYTTWVPGDPIYQQDRRYHMNQGVYTFREITDSWVDAADWPGQTKARLQDGDEIGEFIADWRAMPGRSLEESA